MIWLRGDLATRNLKWFWRQNAPCTSGFCTSKWHSTAAGWTAPEIPRSLSISSLTRCHLLLPSPGCALSRHDSKCSPLLKYECTIRVFQCFIPRLWGSENCLSRSLAHTPKLASRRSELRLPTESHGHGWWGAKQKLVEPRASTTSKSHLRQNRNSRKEAFNGKCGENRKQESKSTVSTFHRQSF